MQSVEEVAHAFAKGAQGTTDHAVAAAGAIMRFFSALHDGRDVEEALAYLVESRSAVDSMSPEQSAALDEHLDLMLWLIEGHVAALLGDPETHLRCIEAAVALANADGRPLPRAMATTLTALTAALVAEPTVVASLAQRAGELNERFGLEWLDALSAAVQAWVDAQLKAATGEQLRMLLETLQDMQRAGHHANAAVIEVLLADVQGVTGDAQGAARTLAGARARPGPYGEAMVRVVDRRLKSLRHSV